MSEWEVVGVIVVLIGLFFTVTKPVIELNKTITRLESKVDALSKSQDAYEVRNSNTHSRLFGTLETHEKLLDEHSIRLHDLDGK